MPKNAKKPNRGTETFCVTAVVSVAQIVHSEELEHEAKAYTLEVKVKNTAPDGELGQKIVEHLPAEIENEPEVIPAIGKWLRAAVPGDSLTVQNNGPYSDKVILVCAYGTKPKHQKIVVSKETVVKTVVQTVSE